MITVELLGGRFDGLVLTGGSPEHFVTMRSDDGETILVYELTEDGRFASYLESYPASIELPPNPIRGLLEGEPDGD